MTQKCGFFKKGQFLNVSHSFHPDFIWNLNKSTYSELPTLLRDFHILSLEYFLQHPGLLAATPAISLPELPPKPFSNNNNTTAMIHMGASMPSSNASGCLKFNHEGSNTIIGSCDSSVEYRRLEDDEMENNMTQSGKFLFF